MKCSTPRRASSTFSCDIRLPPALSKPLGGSAGLLDVPTERHLYDQAVHPLPDNTGTQSNLTTAANKTAFLDDHGKYDSVAEVQNLLLSEPKLLVAGEPVLEEATDRRNALTGGRQDRGFPDGIGSKEAQHRVEVAAVRSFKEAARKLHQVGGR